MNYLHFKQNKCQIQLPVRERGKHMPTLVIKKQIWLVDF